MSLCSEGSQGLSCHTFANDNGHTLSDVSYSRFGSNSSAAGSAHRDSMSRDLRGSLQTDSMGKLTTNPLGTITSNSTTKELYSPSSEHAKRRRFVNKEQMLSYRTYIMDVNYTQGQEQCLLKNGLNLPQERRNEDFLLLTANIVPGYTLNSQLALADTSSMLFYATEDSNNKPFIIRLSPNFTNSVPVARFLNEWYLTSGLNPPTYHRPWCNPLLENKFIAKGKFDLKSDESRYNLRTPITLPSKLPGVLYPLSVFNIDHDIEEDNQKRIGFLYPDYGYKNLRTYYEKDIEEKVNSDESSLNGGSLRSMLSEMSVNERSQNGFLPKRNLGTGGFDDLANRVCQQPKDRLTIINILSDMIAVCTTLAICHELGIVHNGITNDLILKASALPEHMDQRDHLVVLTGWDFAFTICVEDSSMSYRKSNIAEIPHLLPYMSPENTGETTCLVDYRTDFYSAGIVLYESIVGCQPFQSDNPVRLRKMHISQKPIPPLILGQGWISEDLNDIIMKCLEKDPCDRYNNAHALISDLKEVRNDYLRLYNMERDQDQDEQALFHDNTEFHRSRDEIPMIHNNIAKLKKTPWRELVIEDFKKKSEGIHFIVVRGDVGVGKSTLLQELKNIAVSNYDFCITWTYNSADINVTPFKSGILGIQSMVKQILASSEDNIAEWRHKFVTEISTDLSILYAAIPELRSLLGPRYQSIKNHSTANRENGNDAQSESEADLSDKKLENSSSKLSSFSEFDHYSLNSELKLRYIIKQVWKLISPCGVTLLLDDIQWSDPGEIEFIKEVLNYCNTNEEALNMKVIMSYRTGTSSGDKDANRIEYSKLIDLLEIQGCEVSQFSIQRPSKTQFAEFVRDNSFGAGRILPTNKDEYVSCMYEATDAVFLRYNYLMRNLQLRASNEGISLDRLQGLLETKSKPLPMPLILEDYFDIAISNDARELLKYAAIVSSDGYFSLADLMIVTGKSVSEVKELLSECLETRVLVPTGIFYKIPFHLMTSDLFPFDFTDSMIWDMTTKAKYHFDHNALQAYLVAEIDREGKWHKYHELCGLRYHKKLSRDVNVDIDSILTMTYHLFLGDPEVNDADRERYYEIFLTGGRYALATSNLPLTLDFFQFAAKYITPDDRRSQLRLQLTICQVNFHLGNFVECTRLIEQAEEMFGSESSSFLYLKVKCLFQMRQFKRGMRTVLKGLESLGLEVSGEPAKCEEIATKYSNQVPLSISDIRAMRYLRSSSNSKFKLVVDLIENAITPSYVLGMSHLRMALLYQLIRLINIHGVTATCAIPLIHLANFFVQPNVKVDTTKAIELCDVALTLVNKYGGTSQELSGQIYETYVTLMAPFRHTTSELVKFSEAVNTQDATLMKPSSSCMTVFITTSNFILSFLTNWKHASALKEMLKFSNEEDKMIAENGLALWADDITFREYRSKFASIASAQRPDLEFVYLANAVIWLASESRYEEASAIVLDRGYNVLRRLPISILHLEFYFYGALSLCLSSTSNSASLFLAGKIMKMYEIWAHLCPQNFESKLAVLAACYSCTQNNKSTLSVLDKFENAIDTANKATRWIEACLANYLCARWLKGLSESSQRIALHAKNAISIAATLKADKQVKKFREEFSAEFDKLNWTDLPQMLDHRSSLGDRSRINPHLHHILEENVSPGYSLHGPSINTNESNPFDHELIDNASMRKGPQNESPTQSELTKAIKSCLTISESSNIDSIVTSLLESAVLLSNVDYGAIVLNLDLSEPSVKAIGTLNNLYKFDDEPLSLRTDLVPYSVVVHCLLKGEVINKDDNPSLFESKFGNDNYFLHNPCSSVLCIPIKTSTVLGTMYLEQHTSPNEVPKSHLFNTRKIDFLDLLCSQAAVSFSKSLLYSHMELAKKAAEDATAEKASFLANMSHEIRTPFNSLFACSLFLLDTDLTDTQKEYVETIKSSALVTLSIVDGILAFSKIEHGSFTLDCSPLDLNACVESAIQVASDQIKNDNLEIVFYNKCPQISEVLGDSTRIRQIVINLVGNAVKFTMEGHIKVILDAKHMRDDRYEITIAVEDTGIGIPANAKSKVFGAFSQVDGSSSRVYGGSGLSLAISKKLTDIMNGTLRFESVEGAGTTFYFICPFEVIKTIEKPKIPSRRVALICRRTLRSDAFVQQLKFLNASVLYFDHTKGFVDLTDVYDVVFVTEVMLSQLHDKLEMLKESSTRVYYIAEFGSPISHEELQKTGISSTVFTPIKRSKVEEILLQSRKQTEITTNHDPKHTVPSRLAEEYPLRILLAEDNVINLKVALQHLKKLGYVADHAKDGVEALEKCEKLLKEGEKYDVILMDIQMPRKDGISATIQLRELFTRMGHADYIPEIVALTANVAGEDREKCLSCGMIDFISKPILPEELVRVLHKIGARKNALP